MGSLRVDEGLLLRVCYYLITTICSHCPIDPELDTRVMGLVRVYTKTFDYEFVII